MFVEQEERDFSAWKKRHSRLQTQAAGALGRTAGGRSLTADHATCDVAVFQQKPADLNSLGGGGGGGGGQIIDGGGAGSAAGAPLWYSLSVTIEEESARVSTGRPVSGSDLQVGSDETVWDCTVCP